MTATSRKLVHTLRISIDDVRMGMFIAELDRPWTNSPFMLQGFLLTDNLDRQTLQSLVREIVIDPSRSDLSSLSHLPWDLLHEPQPPQPERRRARVQPQTVSAEKIRYRPSAQRPSLLHAAMTAIVYGLGQMFSRTDKLPAKAYYLRHTSASVNDTRTRLNKAERSTRLAPPSDPAFSELLLKIYPRDVALLPLSLFEHWQNWREERERLKPYVRGQNVRRRPPGAARPEYIPDEVKLVIYDGFAPLKEEVGYARKVIHRTDALLKKLERDIQEDQTVVLEKVGPAVNLLTASIISNPGALMWLIRMRAENNAAYAHCLKVAIYMMVLGRHLGFHRQQLNELGYIGLLLDVGKLGLPSGLLDKPQKLSDKERELMRTHVNDGVTILKATDPLAHNVMMGISEHHERLDGSGYPAGLEGNQISIFGRVAAIADSFAAMTSERPYDVTHSPFDAMKELFKQAGTQLHAPLVEEFVQAIGIFPVGSMIELSTGEVAVVIEHNKIRRLEPKVLLLTDPDKTLLTKPTTFDLMRQKNIGGDGPKKIMRGLPDGAYGLTCSDFYQA